MPGGYATSPLPSKSSSSLRQRLASAKTRLRGAPEIDLQIKLIVDRHHGVATSGSPRRSRRARLQANPPWPPGPDTAYRKITKRRFDVQWSTDEQAIAYDRRSDGMYLLMTNDRKLSAAQVLQAHKGQPMIEKRFEQIKTVHQIALVFLHDEGRIEALFPQYAIALLVQATHRARAAPAMAHESHRGTAHLPEQRQCAHPTTEQVLRLFSLAERAINCVNTAAPFRHSTSHSPTCSARCSRCSASPASTF